MNCRNCGAPLDPGARFCRKCGTDVPVEPPAAEKPNFFQKTTAAVRRFFKSPALKNPKTRAAIGIGAAALLLILILILSIASCSGKKLRSPDDVLHAVLSALEQNDGKKLCEMASLSEDVCGAHPELFGEGKDAHAVMLNYYRTLADTHYTQWKETYGRRFRLEAQTATELLTLNPIDAGTSLYEINRALDIDASQYAVLSGPLLINGETVCEISVTAVEWEGEWRLLIVYLY